MTITELTKLYDELTRNTKGFRGESSSIIVKVRLETATGDHYDGFLTGVSLDGDTLVFTGRESWNDIEFIDVPLKTPQYEPCPECGTTLVSGNGGSGVKCPSCPYWFCY